MLGTKIGILIGKEPRLVPTLVEEPRLVIVIFLKEPQQELLHHQLQQKQAKHRTEARPRGTKMARQLLIAALRRDTSKIAIKAMATTEVTITRKEEVITVAIIKDTRKAIVGRARGTIAMSARGKINTMVEQVNMQVRPQQGHRIKAMVLLLPLLRVDVAALLKEEMLAHHGKVPHTTTTSMATTVARPRSMEEDRLHTMQEDNNTSTPHCTRVVLQRRTLIIIRA
ncbi:unnamed protein product [Amoebophrya sp. A25]|nr:unnamed protein product [Amoebophrya sp. A25]|eukprot:GSA25T00003874001.1